METRIEDQERIEQCMARCDSAVNAIRNNRLSRKHADELVGAVMSLTNNIRIVENSKKFGLNGYERADA